MSACNVPPTHKLPPIPTPPATTKAPLLVLVETVVFVKLTIPFEFRVEIFEVPLTVKLVCVPNNVILLCVASTT